MARFECKTRAGIYENSTGPKPIFNPMPLIHSREFPCWILDKDWPMGAWRAARHADVTCEDCKARSVVLVMANDWDVVAGT